MSLVGRVYLERGQPVEIVVQWEYRRSASLGRFFAANGDVVLKPLKAPRNVLVRRVDGSLVVRPFRGLRSTRTALEKF